MTDSDWEDQIKAADPYVAGEVPQYQSQTSIRSLFEEIQMANVNPTNQKVSNGNQPWWQSKFVLTGAIAAFVVVAAPLVLMNRNSSSELVATEPSQDSAIEAAETPATSEPTATTVDNSVSSTEARETSATVKSEPATTKKDNAGGAGPAEVTTETNVSCRLDGSAGSNPLGMRSNLTIDQVAADSTVTFESFGNAAGEGASSQTQSFPRKSASEVLELLKNDRALFLSIIGDSGPEAPSFSELSFVCSP